ncbi:MAG TPA: cache domain-containing protein [Phycisphaerae bacterium]|jgi:two-component system NtrC family sensor kinase|nr:cache domain-containing protein [Phycisphaerae bacterium]HOJ56542.1 cache domain-containing protein [Phycisphaerae bacterium]HOL25237.1 cache domain-containing protein [Phycisphaerae bacterium]HPP22767.1 cache domain-containing protein [Phycisphaerae bacterium]HPU32266.1 cache domain-containing protein [Phycisphaerae bacterium]
MTVQFRLTIRFISVILLAGVALSAFTAYHIARVLLEEVQEQVSRDLNAARAVYDSQTEQIELFLNTAALDATLPALLNNPQQAEDLLKALSETGQLDRLCLLDLEGRVVACAANVRMAGHDLSNDPVVRHTFRRGRSVAGTVLVPRLESETSPEVDSDPEADVLIAPDGMFIALAAATPIRDATGETVGLMYGAHILNNRNNLVDAIRAEVFRYRSWKGIHIGTATIFQGPIRVATNLRNDDGSRAIGTTLDDDEVYRAVLIKGDRFDGIAYVVNDWYFTSYEPLRDPDDRIIGALYVGVLRAPFMETRNTAIGVFLAIVTGVVVLILVLLIAATRQVLHPIERIVEMTGRVAGGDLSARVGIRPSGEMGRLCRAVDAMADAVAEREEQLELATRRQITQSEKLASIGRLAAGIAHEINNPLTGVLTFTSLLRSKPNLDEQDRADLDLVIRETTRVRNIVRGLLDFARESHSRKEALNINEVVHQATWLLHNQKEFCEISMHEQLAEDLPLVYGDRNQLQQVVLNLALNACEAMPDGGTLTIISRAEGEEVVLSIQDTGHGIPREDLEKIFEPFYTTKPVGKGTGLGLSVTYGILQQHGATLGVKSEIGKGSTFTVRLPIAAPAGPASPASADTPASATPADTPPPAASSDAPPPGSAGAT